MADNTKNLEMSWSRRSEEAKEKAVRAINELKQNREPVNFGSVHKKSGVSKHFLYENNEIRNLIDKERNQEETRRTVQHAKYDRTSKSKDVIIVTKEKYIEKLEAENKQLRKEINQLRAMVYEKR